MSLFARHVQDISPLSHVPEVQKLDVAGLIVRDTVCVCVSHLGMYKSDM